ncbi:MAG: phosphatase PAP2 family protein [Anaerolineae bacterium]
MPAKPVKQPTVTIQDAAQQAARAESATAPVRRYRAVLFLIVLVLFAGAFAVLTILVRTTPSIAVDLLISRTIQSIGFPPFAWLMKALSWLGFMPQSVIITALCVLLIYLLGLHWEAVVSLFAAVVSTGTSLLVKDLIQRPRPVAPLVDVFAILDTYSYPSGHVMYYVGFFGFLGFLAFSLLKPSCKRTLILVFLGIPVSLVGASRIYLGQHWASDVLGAYLLGILILAAIILIYRWGKTRFFIHQPVVAEKPEEAN